MSQTSEHWEDIYTRKASDQLSWHRAHLERSFSFFDKTGLGLDAAIVDVGGGASTFVDDLLSRDYRDVTVLDISAAAIDVAKRRLEARASEVSWLVGDITRVDLPAQRFDFWHDRAVFHFLRQPAERARYVDAVRRALRPGGHIVVATFGVDGPERCSGLEVARYSAETLHAEFGGEFRKVESLTELHQTPWGAEQQFVYCYCRLGS